MLIDARTIPTNAALESDVCIVGAGAAGITLAREFAGASFGVLLIEGGGLKFEHKSQFLHRGKSRGRPYPPPENTRRRQFGGTTVTWFGRCRPLDAIDFETRAAVPNSGWPISKPDLDPYFPRAATHCQLDSADFSMPEDVLATAALESKLFRFSPPTNFGAAYLKELDSAANIRILLHANAVEIESGPDSGRATRLVCLTLNGKRVLVSARVFILAVGGLEAPRLLLNSRSVHSRGMGNSRDLVGRYFMEHVYAFTAAVESLPQGFPVEYLRLNYQGFQRNLAPTPAIGLTEAALHAGGLPNCSAFFVSRPLYKTDALFYSRATQDFINLMETLGHRRAPSRQTIRHARGTVASASSVLALAFRALRGRSQYAIHLQTEPVPNPESRVSLADSKDRLGIRELRVDWQLLPQDLRGMLACDELIRRGLETHGVRSRPIEHDRDAEGWPVSLATSKHHMGTTRMSSSPASGVVNSDCRLHEVDNVYVAGSAVFPTAGMANPTLTIVALAVRLADHIKRVLR